jgi:hypothetical protein
MSGFRRVEHHGWRWEAPQQVAHFAGLEAIGPTGLSGPALARPGVAEGKMLQGPVRLVVEALSLIALARRE